MKRAGEDTTSCIYVLVSTLSSSTMISIRVDSLLDFANNCKSVCLSYALLLDTNPGSVGYAFINFEDVSPYNYEQVLSESQLMFYSRTISSRLALLPSCKHADFDMLCTIVCQCSLGPSLVGSRTLTGQQR